MQSIREVTGIMWKPPLNIFDDAISNTVWLNILCFTITFKCTTCTCGCRAFHLTTRSQLAKNVCSQGPTWPYCSSFSLPYNIFIKMGRLPQALGKIAGSFAMSIYSPSAPPFKWLLSVKGRKALYGFWKRRRILLSGGERVQKPLCSIL